ncbi:DnaJ domain-containing protein [Deminuibacter soli]|uniref:J domain-containing protein n=1 Tax=Deminuibacter soli TaxID=2291815 RepID=A0A3E1NH48_9BACT|nr:DnaJ domain-containing protein [Deminuibacter soli]RFM27181.1 hypothetical protein DXN05_17130 [Deminuibacter soli]
MALKDYYKILGISPAASADEVKKAYRRLALRYHPDKNTGNHMAELHFREVKEAYDTLIDAAKREAYNYERFYHYRFLNERPMEHGITADWIARQMITLEETVHRQDFFRIHHDALLFQLQQLLSEYNLEVVQRSENPQANVNIVIHALACTRPLNLAYTRAVCALLQQVAGTDTLLLQRIKDTLKQKKQQQLINRSILPAAVLAVLLILWLIISVTR